MKLYIVSGLIDVSEDGTEFKPSNQVCVSHVECASARKKLTDAGVARKDIDTFDVDVPTTKTELVAFLNVLLSQKLTQDGIKAAVAGQHLVKK